MPRRLLCLLALALLVAAAPAAGDIGSRKAAVDAKINRLQDKIAAARAREARLTREIAEVTTQIRDLEQRVGDVSTRLAVLEDDLALHERRLRALESLYRVQTRRFEFLRDQYATALHRLNTRLVEIYKEDEPSTVEIVLASRSFQEILDQIDYLNAIAAQDNRIASEVGQAKEEVRVARAQTRKLKGHVSAETQVIRVRTDQVAAVRDRLLASKNELSNARSRRRSSLTATQQSEQEFVAEANALAKVSSQLASQIRASQSSSPYTPSTSPGDTSPSVHGLIWPVSGPVTSPFGYRWGRMHEGIDIGAGYGSPIHAAAAGRVIWCGWLGGYGNLTVIDHGGGLATAYGHQSSIAVSCGQEVAQGQVIGYVGSTGHSTGPHLHFEVRVNGAPVDPLGYL